MVAVGVKVPSGSFRPFQSHVVTVQSLAVENESLNGQESSLQFRGIRPWLRATLSLEPGSPCWSILSIVCPNQGCHC